MLKAAFALEGSVVYLYRDSFTSKSSLVQAWPKSPFRLRTVSNTAKHVCRHRYTTELSPALWKGTRCSSETQRDNRVGVLLLTNDSCDLSVCSFSTEVFAVFIQLCLIQDFKQKSHFVIFVVILELYSSWSLLWTKLYPHFNKNSDAVQGGLNANSFMKARKEETSNI